MFPSMKHHLLFLKTPLSFSCLCSLPRHQRLSWTAPPSRPKCFTAAGIRPHAGVRRQAFIAATINPPDGPSSTPPKSPPEVRPFPAPELDPLLPVELPSIEETPPEFRPLPPGIDDPGPSIWEPGGGPELPQIPDHDILIPEVVPPPRKSFGFPPPPSTPPDIMPPMRTPPQIDPPLTTPPEVTPPSSVGW